MPKPRAEGDDIPLRFGIPVEILFWSVVALVVWCYAGYPLFILFLARARPRRLQPAPAAAAQPAVTVIVAVRDGRATLARRVGNLLEQLYPIDRLEVILACNGSQDGTEALAH